MDIFVHTWDKADYSTYANVNLGKLEELYKPKKLIVQSPFELPKTQIMVSKNTERLRSLNNVLSMFYKIKTCNDLKSEYEQENGFTYDCVIRFRADINLHHQMRIDDLETLSVPRYGDFGGLNDQFAWGSSRDMDIYTSLYDQIDAYLNIEGTHLCMKPEYFVQFHLEKHQISPARPYLKYTLKKRMDEELDNELRTFE